MSPGRCYWLLTAAVHVIAAGAVATLPMVPALAGVALVLASAILTWRRRPRWTHLTWGGYGSLRLVDAAGNSRYCERLDSLFRTSWLVVIALRDADGLRCTVPVFAAEQPDTVRRLNQRLLAGRRPVGPPLEGDGV